MNSYPKYKDSGVEWLRRVPDHWELVRIKPLIESFKGGIWGDEAEGNEEDVVCVRVADFDMDTLGISTDDLTVRNVATRYQKGRLLEEGDLLIEKSGGGDKQLVGRVVAYDIPHKAVCSNFLGRITPRTTSVHPRFLLYSFQHLYNNDVNSRSIKQTTGIQNIDTGSYFDERIGLPPLPEQRVIADYLDRKTAQIDTLIAKKQRLIDLLKERRTAVINRAVTKGLDPDVPMTDSGSRFFPTIPSHWSLPKLGYLCSKIADGPHFSPDYVEDGIMFLSARNVKVDGWSLSDAKYISEDDYQEFSKRVKPEIGDVLYTKGGTTGIARVVDFEDQFQVWVHIAVLKLYGDKIDPNYLAYTLNSSFCYSQSQLYTRGATNNDLGLTRMSKIVLPLPPLREQENISDFLDAETKAIDDVIKRESEEISFLQELRTSLISEVVTGKIDVRGRVPEAAVAA